MADTKIAREVWDKRTNNKVRGKFKKYGMTKKRHFLKTEKASRIV